MSCKRLLVALALVLASCGPSQAAIAFDSSVSGGTSTSYTFNNVGGNIVFCGAENNLAAGNSPVAPTSFTYNSVAMTNVASDVFTAAGTTSSLWMLQNAPTGSHTVAVTGGTGYFASVCVSYSGAATTGQPDATTTGRSFPGLTLTLTASANAWTVAVFTKDGGVNLTPGAGTTVRIVDTSNMNGGIADSNGAVSGSTSLIVTDGTSVSGSMASFTSGGSPPPSSLCTLSLLGVGKC